MLLHHQFIDIALENSSSYNSNGQGAAHPQECRINQCKIMAKRRHYTKDGCVETSASASFPSTKLAMDSGIERLKRVMKLAGIFLIALTVTACSEKPYSVKPAFESSDAIRSHQFFVVNHGWHTGLIIAAKYLHKTIPELKERFGNVAYYEIGWGDKGFYQAQEITTKLTLQAIFWSEGAVMHVVAVPNDPGEYFGQSEVINSCLTDEQISSLIKFISMSFARDSEGHVVHLKRGIYGNSRFYDGEGRFYLLNTCNKWTAKGLQSAGVNISPSLSLTAGSVMSVMRALRQQCTMTPSTAVEGTPPLR